jgi:hypothetical protein
MTATAGVGIVTRLFGGAISETVAFAAGAAIGPVLGPPVQALKNATWEKYPDVPPPYALLAEGVAQGQVDEGAARKWAAQHGIGDTAFTALIDIANTGPPLGSALEAFRRGFLSQGEYQTALNRAGIEKQWFAALEQLAHRLLSPAELANARQQGYIDQARQHADTTAQGYTDADAEIMFEVVGLPPGVAEGLEMLRRAIIDDATFAQIVAEGHTKTKYTPQLLELRTRVLSAIQYVDARVRGWINNQEMYAGGALTGYQPADLDMLHRTHGRPLSFRQTWIGLQRGGKRLDATADLTPGSEGIDPTFWAALQQSDIQQQWYSLAWAQRYSYPSAFVLRALAQSGDIDAATLTQTLTYLGWEPTFVTKVVTAWTSGTTGATAKKETEAHLAAEYEGGHITQAEFTTGLEALGYDAAGAARAVQLADFRATKKYRDKAITAIGNRYLGLQLTDAEAEADLAALGVPASAVGLYLQDWRLERDDLGTTLTKAQTVRAFKLGTLDQANALARLGDLGMSAADAQILLTDA